MSTIYLPVEVSRRELMARAFLATRLASEGHEVFVFVSDFFDRWGWPGPGIYIGKNVLRSFPPHDLTYYDRMKASGVRVWYHDEESALFPGQDPEDWLPHLARRTDVSVLGEGDKVLVWGQLQYDYYTTLPRHPELHLVGSINFELYRPEYQTAFSEYDANETGGLKDYILFNTRFFAPNPFWFGKGHVINSDYFTYLATDQERYSVLAHEGIALYQFIGLVAEVALRLPDEIVCLRPHPAENPALYRDIFANLPNVRITDKGDAASWIRQARCLVQNGCTTGLQATVAEKPVITFVPPGTTDLVACSPLPNEVGALAETREEAFEAIVALPPTQETGRWRMMISRLDALDAIATLVAAEDSVGATNERHVRSIAFRNKVDMWLRRAAYRFVPGKVSQWRMRERFLDRDFFLRFPELVRIANKKWTAPIVAERLSDDCFRVRANGDDGH